MMRFIVILAVFAAILIPALSLAQDPATAAPTEPATAAPAETPAAKPDPVGSETGKMGAAAGAGIGSVTADDIKALSDNASAPATKGDVSKAMDAVGQTAVSLNFVWMLVCGFLVMFMQAGFAMVEAGFCRAKNAVHVIMTNFMIYPIGMLGFWAAGFALMYGSYGGIAVLGGNPILTGTEVKLGTFGLFGTQGFFLNPSVYDVAVYGFFLFQMVFMDTTATIPTGAMAERWRFGAFVVYGFFVSMIAYPIYGHLVWGGGGLATLGANYGLGHGAVDFAGSSVVHAVGGFVALAGSIVLGARKGKFGPDGKAVVIAGHHIPMATIGTFILAFGWFGFNAGSTLAATGGNLRITVIAVNTMLASAGGALAAALYMKATVKKWDAGMMINGMLAGLVAITAPCAFVDAISSVAIGVIAGVLVIWSVAFVENKLKVDDPVGAISVHGVCGLFGMLAVGIFSDGSFGAGWNAVLPDKGVTGILHGDTGQFLAQLIACVVCAAWAFGSGYAFFKIQSMVMKIRSDEADEDSGVDMPEMGSTAYPEFGV